MNFFEDQLLSSTFLTDDQDVLANPLAATMGDLVMARQLEIIRRIERERGIVGDAERECRKYLGCRPEDLSRRAAAALIQHLSRRVVRPHRRGNLLR